MGLDSNLQIDLAIVFGFQYKKICTMTTKCLNRLTVFNVSRLYSVASNLVFDWGKEEKNKYSQRFCTKICKNTLILIKVVNKT